MTRLAARLLLPLLLLSPFALAQDGSAPSRPPAGTAGGAPAAEAPAAEAPSESPPEEQEPRGLRVASDGAFPGYTLIAPLNSRAVHLVDLDGEVVHTWDTEYRPGAATYLLDNGNLLHCGHKEDVPRFRGGGIGGVVQELDWDGNGVWEYELASERSILHHGVSPMPNGNLLLIAWEAMPPGIAAQWGRDPEHIETVGLWPDAIHELRPTRPAGGEIVWSWRAADHLVQDFDAERLGYGAIAEHVGRIDINADHRYEKDEEDLTEEEIEERQELEDEMRELGYLGGDEGGDEGDDEGEEDEDEGPPPSGDFLHTNSVEYLPEHDLIVLSTPHLCELWIIDHSTTTQEAKGDTGGRFGRGGELLWRWGNPRNYGMGDELDQRLFYQHNPTWLAGEDGSLRLLVYNNGGGRPDEREFSSVEELVLPFDPERGFSRERGRPFGPEAPAWIYSDEGEFFSAFISGAQRLANGNTLICEGARGRVFEVRPDGEIVWDWLSPLGGELEPSPTGGRAPPLALFRATRVGMEHPAVVGRLAASR